ncbi:RrF2 family transcriptional regulator, partial [Alistipes ihumii]
MLSKKTRYAILALASLAREFGNGPVPISRIAGDEHIPQRFLEGILLELKNGGVLGSVRGKAGGYYLSRDPGEVTLCDVVTRFEGTAGMLACA